MIQQLTHRFKTEITSQHPGVAQYDLGAWTQIQKKIMLKKMMKKNNAASTQSLSPNLTQPNLTFPPTNKLCPQLNLNHLPLGCQPCLLPLSQTLPSEKTTILLYKYQRYIILLATRKHHLYSRLKILEFSKQAMAWRLSRNLLVSSLPSLQEASITSQATYTTVLINDFPMY